MKPRPPSGPIKPTRPGTAPRAATAGRGAASDRVPAAGSGARPAAASSVRPAPASASGSGSAITTAPASGPRSRSQPGQSSRSAGLAAARPAARGMTSEGPGRARSMRARGRGLRTKFMLVLAGVTVAVMVVLGVAMAKTSEKFLFGIKQHAGIEIAKLAAQIGVSIEREYMERLERSDRREADEIRKDYVKRLETLLRNATTWGDGDTRIEDASDVYAVRFNDAGDFLNGQGIGVPDEGANIGTPFRQIFIAKSGKSVNLPDSLKVYEADARLSNGQSRPIYRFKIALGGKFDKGHVRVDIARESVVRVANNLYLIIAIAVLVAIGVVIAIANWLAGNITRPVDQLLKDIQVVSRGNLSHQTKPHSDDEIGVLATEFNKMTQNLLGAQAALVEQEKADYELSLAREVQRQLLPADAPQIGGYDCAAFYQGAKAVSGDYFDMIPLGNGLWGFIVADVSGKGIPGSMVMAVTRTIVRLVANKHQARAAETLKETNRLIAKQIKRGMFVTAFYAILDESTGIVTYASAGHNPMVVYRAGTKGYELATTKGIAVGFNDGPIFDKTIVEARLQLQPGDALLLYTDGFPEAMNEKNEEFGEERFYQAVATHGHQEARGLIQSLVQEVAGHRGRAEQSDDLTIITVRRVS